MSPVCVDRLCLPEAFTLGCASRDQKASSSPDLGWSILPLGYQPLWELQPAPIRLLLFFREYFCGLSHGENAITTQFFNQWLRFMSLISPLFWVPAAIRVLPWRKAPTSTTAIFGACSKQCISAVLHPVCLPLSFTSVLETLVYLYLSLKVSAFWGMYSLSSCHCNLF